MRSVIIKLEDAPVFRPYIINLGTMYNIRDGKWVTGFGFNFCGGYGRCIFDPGTFCPGNFARRSEGRL